MPEDVDSNVTDVRGKSIEVYKISLVLTPQPEGGYTVTSPVLPELITEGDTLQEALHNVEDALKAVVELDEDFGRRLPTNVRQDLFDALSKQDQGGI
jgi:antitoxin HicB